MSQHKLRQKKAQTNNIAEVLSRGANKHEFTILSEENARGSFESNMASQTQILPSD